MRSNHGLTSRRTVLKGLLAGAGAAAFGPLMAACSSSPSTSPTSGSESGSGPSQSASNKPKRGGVLRVGFSGASEAESLSPLQAYGLIDYARAMALYDPLIARDAAFKPELLLAEEMEVENGGDSLLIRLREDVTFHHGKDLGADDLMYSLEQWADPKISFLAAGLSGLDLGNAKRLDKRTVRIPQRKPNFFITETLSGDNAIFIFPADFDPKNPQGTGPFKYKSFTPGGESVFDRNENYWVEGEPYFDSLVSTGFSDETARMNALLANQIDIMPMISSSQTAALSNNKALGLLVGKGYSTDPITMRVDKAPFDDVRVRQAFKLIIDRKQMVETVLSGYGQIGNDLYCPVDPLYAGSIPQREQDLDQARSLLKAAGQENLTIELPTGPYDGQFVPMAQTFAEQAKGAGVTVNVTNLSVADLNSGYGEFVFGLDADAGGAIMQLWSSKYAPDAAYNSTHWADPHWEDLYTQAMGEADEAKRVELITECQRILHEDSGTIIWGFPYAVDAHTPKLAGLVAATTGFSLNGFKAFRQAWFE